MLRTFPLLAALCLTGCIVNDDPVAIDNIARLMPNGTSANGVSIGGVSLSGVSPLGKRATGAPIMISDIAAPFTGAGIVGSFWNGRLTDGTAVGLRVDEALRGTGSNADLWSYRISISIMGAWRPLCGDGLDAAGFADTVRGTWNLSQGVPGGGAYQPTKDFTIACRGSAIAKCLELGYKPWNGTTEELAACVRAVRADYCGDGTSYTVDGTTVNLFDVAGIQSDDAAWVPEAEWTADGASCVSRKANTRFFQVAHYTPACFQITLPAKNSCGSGFAGEATIITELPRR